MYSESGTLERAIASYKSGDTKESRRLLDIVFGTDPVAFRSNPTGRKLRGLLRMQEGDMIRGEEDLQYAATNLPDPVLLYYLGMKEARLPTGFRSIDLLEQSIRVANQGRSESASEATSFPSWGAFYCLDRGSESYPMERFNDPFQSRYFREALWQSSLSRTDQREASRTLQVLARKYGRVDLIQIPTNETTGSSPGKSSSAPNGETDDESSREEKWKDIQGCLDRASSSLEKTGSPAEKKAIQSDILSLLRFRAYRDGSLKSLFALGEATIQESTLESLHAYRSALEKSGFYQIGPRSPDSDVILSVEILLRLERVYRELGKKAEALTIQRMAGTLVQFHGLPELKEEMLRVTSSNRHCREALRFQVVQNLHNENGSGEKYSRELKARDDQVEYEELKDLYFDYP